LLLRRFILLFGLLNACLFAALLPLWEGFDEAFHYGYVETLWETGKLPVLGRTLLPADVAASFRVAPLSHIVCRWIAEATPFDQWFSLPLEQQTQRRSELDRLRPGPADSSRPNYEAHHPPLAYAVLALPDRLLSRQPITARVLVLRLVGALLSTTLIWIGASALGRTLQLPAPFLNAALFTVFCSEMLYASIAHVANDWLAVGIGAMFLAALAEFIRKPDRRSAIVAAGCLSAGLLTKAYFLVFVALAAVLMLNPRTKLRRTWPAAALVLVIAGPWYARNVALYGNVPGTHEEFDGIGVRQALAAAPHIDWPATAGFLARGSLWTGNNSFTTFSQTTLDVLLALLAVAFAGWIARHRSIESAEWIIFAAIVLFSIAVAYASAASFAHTHGETAGASPWYTQALLAPVMILAFLGLSRWKTAGALVAVCITALSAWILIATWTVKLFPMYSGGSVAPMHPGSAWHWWTHDAAAHAAELSLTAITPARVLYTGLSISVVLTVLLAAATMAGVVKWPRMAAPASCSAE